VQTDVQRLDEIERLAARTIDAFGAVHVVCNNAGVESGATFADIPAETWDWVLGVDLLGTIYGIKTFLPLLREHAPDGHIVNTSSIAGLDSYFLTASPYVAAKHAIVGISETLFHELQAGSEDIGVSVLCPGMIATQMPWSERNRPDHVPSSLEHPSRAQLIEITTQGAANGMPPAEVADMVVDAIRTKRFYILTHPEAAENAARNRLRWITENVAPAAPTFT
jgi:NAD(P)-dependent dehydrogenase (short-subunit alcohol dehydrogenase family)